MSEETKHNFPFFSSESYCDARRNPATSYFEPRYKQLIHDIQTSGEHFGIPFMLNNKYANLGRA